MEIQPQNSEFMNTHETLTSSILKLTVCLQSIYSFSLPVFRTPLL